ncbi:hypothetical protein NECAME_12591, partial [Necator americanus]
FVYLLVTIDYVKGPRFGLGIKHHKDKVVVSKSEKGSLCGDLLKRLDRIIDVNGTEVADRDVCREMLIKSLKRTNKVTLVIERPVKKEAIEAMEDYLADACRQSLPSSPTPNVNNIKVQNVLSSIIQRKANNSHRSDSIGKGKSLASKKLNSNEKNDSPEKGRSLSLRKKQSDSIHKGKNAGFRKLRSGDKLIDNLREVYKSMRREPSDKTMREHESPVLVKSKKGNSRLVSKF